MYTTETIPYNVQKEILCIAKKAVRSIVAAKYPKFFTNEDIEDIIGDVILKACRSIDKYNPAWALSTWIGKIAHNCVLDTADKKAKRSSISQEMYKMDENGEEREITDINTYKGDGFEADRDIEMAEFYEAVENATSGLDEKDKTFYEKMENGEKPSEIAKELGGNANTAAIRTFKIRKELKEPFAQIAKEFDISCKKLAS